MLAEHKNLVIEGPPGTGKSQTITNLIAASLDEGKKILFVAEKLAALEVVKARLSRAGLGPFVLELHSNKTSKKKVLEELAARKDFNGKATPNLPQKLQQLDGYRTDLKAYRDLINSPARNAFGVTLHQIMWRAERRRRALSVEDRVLAPISVRDATEISEIELSRRTDCLSHLAAQYLSIGGFDTDSTFWGFFPDRIVPGDETKLEQLFYSSCDWADRFVDDVTRYGEALLSNVMVLAQEYAEAQLQALRALLASAKADQPVHLIPKLFEEDNTGARAQRILEAFSAQLHRYHALAPVVQRGLRAEHAANQSRLNILRQLDRVAGQLGAVARTPGDLVEFCRSLRRERQRLVEAIQTIEEFCAEKRIPFRGDRSDLERLAQLAKVIGDVPDELLHLQTPGLTREGCRQALEALADVQARWARLRADLNTSIYIDALPSEENLKQAILVLRQGGKWYRAFQSRWRSAVAIHKGIFAISSDCGRLTGLNSSKGPSSFSSSASAGRMIQPGPNTSDFLPRLRFCRWMTTRTLARWNRSAIVLMEEVRAQVYSPRNLTPEEARVARREFAEFGSHLSLAVSALREIDSLLPRLADIRGEHAIDKCVEVVGRFVEGIEFAGRLD